MAQTRSNLSAGVVYSGKLERVALIFLDRSAAARFVELAGASGDLVSARQFSEDPNRFELRALTSSLFRTVTQLVEDRTNSVKCQYFIRVQDEDLLSSIDPSTFNNVYQGNDINFQVQDELIQTRNSIIELEQRVFSIERRMEQEEISLEESEYFEAIQDLLDKRKELVEILLRPDSEEDERLNKLVAIVNPCRSFEEDEELLVISYGFEYVLEKVGSTIVDVPAE